MPFLMNTDAALKYQLQGLVVHDQNSGAEGRPVKVRYRSPEDEVAKFTPPLILIEMPMVSIAWDRAHMGEINLPYVPEGGDLSILPKSWAKAFANPDGAYDPSLSPYETWCPVPYNLDYQITVYTRMAREHLMPIMAALEADEYLGRFAKLVIPQTNTFERVTRMAGPERSYQKDENGKRLFRATYSIRVATELVGPIIPPPVPCTAVELSIAYGFSNPDLTDYYNENDLKLEDVTESVGIIGSRTPLGWKTD